MYLIWEYTLYHCRLANLYHCENQTYSLRFSICGQCHLSLAWGYFVKILSPGFIPVVFIDCHKFGYVIHLKHSLVHLFLFVFHFAFPSLILLIFFPWVCGTIQFQNQNYKKVLSEKCRSTSLFSISHSPSFLPPFHPPTHVTHFINFWFILLVIHFYSS